MRDQIVLALDQATKTGWTVGSPRLAFNEWTSGFFKAPKRPDEGERLIIIEDSVLALIDAYKPSLIAMERRFNPTRDAIEAARQGREARVGFDLTTMDFLTKVQAAVQMAAARRSLPIEDYAAQSWRATLKMPKAPDYLKEEWAALGPGKEYAARKKWIKATVVKLVKQYGGKVEGHDEADSWGICLHACHGEPAAKRAQGDLLSLVD